MDAAIVMPISKCPYIRYNLLGKTDKPREHFSWQIRHADQWFTYSPLGRDYHVGPRTRKMCSVGQWQ